MSLKFLGDVKFPIPLELTGKLELNYFGPTWKRLTFGVDFHLFKISKAGFELVYGIDWSGGFNSFVENEE